MWEAISRKEALRVMAARSQAICSGVGVVGEVIEGLSCTSAEVKDCMKSGMGIQRGSWDVEVTAPRRRRGRGPGMDHETAAYEACEER